MKQIEIKSVQHLLNISNPSVMGNWERAKMDHTIFCMHNLPQFPYMGPHFEFQLNIPKIEI